MRSDPALQAALDAYSVAVQRYKTLSDLLPPPLRPPVLDHFAHRQNRWAVERRTTDVRKIVARMERQLRGMRPQVLPSAVISTAAPDGHAEATIAADQISSKSGQPGQPAVDTHHSLEVDKTEPKGYDELASRDDDAASMKSSVVTPGKNSGFSDVAASFVGNSLYDSVLCRADSGSPDHMPRDDRDVVSPAADTGEEGLTAAEELEAIVRVGIVSPDAAIEMSRAVDRVKEDGASAASVRKVYATFLRCIEEGASFPEVEIGAERGDE
ncbi:hypothetical protein FN846DRAFT_903755 [Sphaerosporella brunnea]|uniref:Uncharacterized protein n=1 Tax=Sphaerosporella brunnea TaxID=1250544 RepID=A0A5J5F5Q9_9PEZI|nr:hypothetical protein FN846DRAFT_903755 [Sphaerosporella brunnea]